MGLDMYAFRMTKPNLPDRIYIDQELKKMGFRYLSQSEVEDAPGLHMDLLPYTQALQVQVTFVDEEKIKTYYGFDEVPFLGMIGGGLLIYHGRKNGEDYSARISQKDIEERFSTTAIKRCNVYRAEEVAYWRKEYSVSEFFDKEVGPVENTGFYVLPLAVQKEYNRLFGAEMGQLPEEAPTKDSAIFYWEWY